MSSSKTYLQFILDQLTDLEDIQYRAMMGEFIIYYRQKMIGGIYDNRFLIKPVEPALAMISKPIYALPYEGGKRMLLVEDVDNKAFLTKLITTMYDSLPEPKKKAKKVSR
ncbi:transcriptional regulator [Pasteurella multocida]|uniref:TfoX/Sxy family protein n=1 Tax=Pasteurella multocida TaxID=747 RepID=UPI00292F9A3D|nr:transcriptional regulator [Pasteurella multocida]